MITNIHHRRPTGPSYASGGEPGYTTVRWTCDRCGVVGEWDDRPHREDGKPHESPSEGDAAYCEGCAEKMHGEDEE